MKRKPGSQPEDMFSSISDFESSLFDQSSLQTTFNTSNLSSVMTTSSTSTLTANSVNSNQTMQHSLVNKHLLHKVILSTTFNVNLVHEILRNVIFFFSICENYNFKLILGIFIKKIMVNNIYFNLKKLKF